MPKQPKERDIHEWAVHVMEGVAKALAPKAATVPAVRPALKRAA